MTGPCRVLYGLDEVSFVRRKLNYPRYDEALITPAGEEVLTKMMITFLPENCCRDYCLKNQSDTNVMTVDKFTNINQSANYDVANKFIY